jgi:hypothetical protein
MEPTVKPSIRTAIQYDPRGRGLRLALSYTRVPRPGDRHSHDLYGFLAGYVGGGCFGFEDFHVEKRREEGFVSYTPAASCTGWDFDRIGSSGLADSDFAGGIERLLNSIHDYVFRRWLTWTDDGPPDLQNSVKRRLSCERRRVFYLSPGFDYDLLTFMSPRWPISLMFGPETELLYSHHQEVLDSNRACQRGVELAVTKYPELVGGGLRFLERQLVGRRAVLLFRDESAGTFIVEPKWGPPTETEIRNLAHYKATNSCPRHAPIRAVLFGTEIPPERRDSLSECGIEWREIRCEDLVQFLREKRDETLAGLFEFPRPSLFDRQPRGTLK